MSKTLDPMDLKQIITLHLDGMSNRKIGETLGISRNTINRYLQLFKGSDYSFSELLKFDEAMLKEQFSVKTTIDMTAIRYNPQCKALFDRMKCRGKNGKVALIAVSNKLLKQAFAIAKSGAPYMPDYRSKLVLN